MAGAMVAPNIARIKALVTQVERSSQFPDKWLLQIEIAESKSVSGPHFARPGRRAEAFTLTAAWEWTAPVTVEADAEYLGGPHNGVFQLTNLRLAQ
jgi:hypothetical protein